MNVTSVPPCSLTLPPSSSSLSPPFPTLTPPHSSYTVASVSLPPTLLLYTPPLMETLIYPSTHCFQHFLASQYSAFEYIHIAFFFVILKSREVYFPPFPKPRAPVVELSRDDVEMGQSQD